MEAVTELYNGADDISNNTSGMHMRMSQKKKPQSL